MGVLVASNAAYAANLLYERPYKLHAVNAVRFGTESLMVMGQAGMMLFPAGGSTTSESSSASRRRLMSVSELTGQSPLNAAAFKNVGWSVAGIFTLAYLVTVTSLFLKLSILGKAKEKKAVNLKKKKVRKEEEEEEDIESPRKVQVFAKVDGKL